MRIATQNLYNLIWTPELKKLKDQYTPMCLNCQKKAGGVFCNRAVTMIHDKCLGCGKNKMIVPACDFNWPEDNRVAIFD